MDIRSTLAVVCRKVTHDRGAEDGILVKRCKGLKLLGEFFLARGGNTQTGLKDLKDRLKRGGGPGPGTADTTDSSSYTSGTYASPPSTTNTTAEPAIAEPVTTDWKLQSEGSREGTNLD
jgi:hypothetical protein